jgi:hypothetical protein
MTRIPDDPPDEELTPNELHDRFESVTNLEADGLREFKDSKFNAAYLEQNSEQAQEGNEPLNDAIRLAETPADEWRDKDDGFNEVEEAEELLDFQRRTQGAIESQGLGDNYLTDEEVMPKREAASIRWGIDPDDEREW